MYTREGNISVTNNSILLAGHDAATGGGGGDSERSDEDDQSEGVEELSEAGLTGDLASEIERTVGPTGKAGLLVMILYHIV